jgi:hypothetical protein
MFCPFCGNEIPDDSEFCSICGKSIPTDDADLVSQPRQRQQRQQRQMMTEERAPSDEKHFFVHWSSPNFSSFSGFVSSIKEITGVSEPSLNINNPYEYNVPIVPDCIAAEENEVVVKQYNIAKLRSRIKRIKADGRLMVTNKRVLFRAAGTSLTGNVLQESQFNIEEIAGIEITKNYRFSFLNLIGAILVTRLVMTAICMVVLKIFKELLSPLISSLGGSSKMYGGGSSGKGSSGDLDSLLNPSTLIVMGFILGTICLIALFCIYKHHWLKLVFASLIDTFYALSLIGVALIQEKNIGTSVMNGFFIILIIVGFILFIYELLVVCLVPNLTIKINVKSGSPAIFIGSRRPFAEVLPWEDTVMAINELGTLIDDLQKQGDYAIKRWTK